MRRISTTGGARWLLRTFQPTIDGALKNSRFSTAMGTNVQLCYLTATGRKSGEPRTVPLTYVRVDNGVALVATNYGQDHHPAWSYNLDADPRCTIEIGDESWDGVARRANDDEATHIWPLFEAVWPGYETYRNIAPRDIRVYVVEPSASDDANGGS